jgi:ArsR family transcriptional regulator, lead/cadmium/zinc/bismuth-responsive transcriptional repressor
MSTHAHKSRAAKELPSDDALTRAAALFRAVGDVSRLRLLYQLGDSEWCVSELADHAGAKLSTLSQQLRVLYTERIVERRRDGKHIYYRLADEHVQDLVRAAIEHATHR